MLNQFNYLKLFAFISLTQWLAWRHYHGKRYRFIYSIVKLIMLNYHSVSNYQHFTNSRLAFGKINGHGMGHL